MQDPNEEATPVEPTAEPTLTEGEADTKPEETPADAA